LIILIDTDLRKGKAPTPKHGFFCHPYNLDIDTEGEKGQYQKDNRADDEIHGSF
jgi:hypothetical protein